ncbi:MAG: hypothetical protein MSH61_05955 [Bacteroidales bacterium]|nr:hypothetical protein [Bacteroidales bacterium]
MVSPADRRRNARSASILDFRARLANRCKDFPVYVLQRASILDFRARLANRCKDFPVYALQRASILDFRARLGNRCKVLPVYPLFRASILDFRARLANRCKETCERRRFSAFTYISCLSGEQQAQIIVSLFLKIP